MAVWLTYLQLYSGVVTGANLIKLMDYARENHVSISTIQDGAFRRGGETLLVLRRVRVCSITN